jgi:hypothetical protein
MPTPAQVSHRTRMFLVDDEVEEFIVAGRSHRVRIRIWRAQDVPPIVLASRVPGGGPPRLVTTRVADLAFGPMLGFPAEGMVFCESDGERLEVVTFGALEGTMRLRHVDPRRRPMPIARFREFIGSDLAD